MYIVINRSTHSTLYSYLAPAIRVTHYNMVYGGPNLTRGPQIVNIIGPMGSQNVKIWGPRALEFNNFGTLGAILRWHRLKSGSPDRFWLPKMIPQNFHDRSLSDGPTWLSWWDGSGGGGLSQEAAKQPIICEKRLHAKVKNWGCLAWVASLVVIANGAACKELSSLFCELCFICVFDMIYLLFMCCMHVFSGVCIGVYMNDWLNDWQCNNLEWLARAAGHAELLALAQPSVSVGINFYTASKLLLRARD